MTRGVTLHRPTDYGRHVQNRPSEPQTCFSASEQNPHDRKAQATEILHKIFPPKSPSEPYDPILIVSLTREYQAMETKKSPEAKALKRRIATQVLHHFHAELTDQIIRDLTVPRPLLGEIIVLKMIVLGFSRWPWVGEAVAFHHHLKTFRKRPDSRNASP